MSSIAYISDERMLEFHRTQGNLEINFWRFSTKNFERLEKNDLLFFIDKKSVHPITKEKGIIGYGRVSDIRNMSVENTWKMYREKNGYEHRAQFEQAIVDLNGNDQFPKQLQSILCDRVVFFNGAIYLSEFDFHLPKKLESFIYLEKNKKSFTCDILKKGLLCGPDTWFSTFQQQANISQRMAEDLIEQRLREAINEVPIQWTYEQKQLSNRLKKSHAIINNIAYRYHNKSYDVVVPCSSFKKQFFEIFGIIQWIQKELEGTPFKFYISMRNYSEEDLMKILSLNAKPLDTSAESF